MQRMLFLDIETDGLNPSKIFICVTKDKETNRVTYHTRADTFNKLIEKQEPCSLPYRDDRAYRQDCRIRQRRTKTRRPCLLPVQVQDPDRCHDRGQVYSQEVFSSSDNRRRKDP